MLIFDYCGFNFYEADEVEDPGCDVVVPEKVYLTCENGKWEGSTEPTGSDIEVEFIRADRTHSGEVSRGTTPQKSI